MSSRNVRYLSRSNSSLNKRIDELEHENAILRRKNAGLRHYQNVIVRELFQEPEGIHEVFQKPESVQEEPESVHEEPERVHELVRSDLIRSEAEPRPKFDTSTLRILPLESCTPFNPCIEPLSDP